MHNTVPGAGIPLRLVDLQDQEVGERFHGDQAQLHTVKVFILAQGDVLRCHGRSQLAALLLIVVSEQLLQEGGQVLVATVGGGDERSQLG